MTSPRESSLALVSGKPAFVYNCGGEPTEVPVSFTKKDDSAKWEQIFTSPVFQSWAAQFEQADALQLKTVDVKLVDYDTGGEPASLVLQPAVTSASGESLSEPVLLRGQESAGVLVILRVSASHPSEQPASAGGRSSGPGSPNWSRDYALFASMPRAAVGKTNHYEILSGKFDAEGRFHSTSADELAAVLDVRINKGDLVSLTRQRVVTSASQQLHQVNELYLYRLNITDDDLALLPKAPGSSAAAAAAARDGEVSPGARHLIVTSLGEAWRMTTDSKSMAALFLFHEFRYHGLMPKYKPPRDSKGEVAIEKRKATFVDINSLYPDSSGVNLRAKIIGTASKDAVVEVTRRGAEDLKQVRLKIGDASACINFQVEGPNADQISALFVDGTKLLIRNARVAVVDSRMLLTVDKWGKVDVVNDEDGDNEFDFRVNQDEDKSSVEYELVVEDGGSAPPSAGSGGIRGGRGRGGRGRGGRGRGGARRENNQHTESRFELRPAAVH